MTFFFAKDEKFKKNKKKSKKKCWIKKKYYLCAKFIGKNKKFIVKIIS